jgi:hypothetical protein
MKAHRTYHLKMNPEEREGSFLSLFYYLLGE